MTAMAAAIQRQRFIDQLPNVRGTIKFDALLSKITWFRVGGPADVLFTPKDEDDLCTFLGALPDEVPVTVIGVGSNLLVRDGGLDGVVIKLGAAFSKVEILADHQVRAGAAAFDVAVAKKAMEASIAGLEFLRGIPGTVGGALRMNAGAYERETKDVLIEAEGVTRSGQKVKLSQKDMGFSYRHSSAPDDVLFTSALFQGTPGDQSEIAERMEGITEARESSQPVRSRTGGSTFKNPHTDEAAGRKAWQLIDAAGCRGASIGDAQVSEQHCNFLINNGSASSEDLERLGEKVRSEVAKSSGINLEWEIRRIGRPLDRGASGT